MKLGVLTVALGELPFEEACKFLAQRGVQMVEIGCGGFPGKAHCDAAELLADDEKCKAFQETLAKYGLEISALSSHGNMVHPDQAVAARFEKDFTNAILLAEKLGVPVVNTFSGCPGGSAADKTPNWVTCPWPEDFSEILEYQWNEVLIPYWKEKAAFARAHGVHKIALELHPGFCVYNTEDFSEILEYQWNEVLIPYWKEKAAFARAHGVHKIALELHPGFCVYNTKTLLRLREAVGPEIGANFDPSHLIWQGMDPCVAVRELGKAGAIFHFHAKDTKVDSYNTMINGVLDTTHYGEELERSWIFRTVGYGHGEDYWRDMISQLRMTGYDYAISIEHEDGLMSGREGLEKAIRFLQNVLIFEDRGAMYWA